MTNMKFVIATIVLTSIFIQLGWTQNKTTKNFKGLRHRWLYREIINKTETYTRSEMVEIWEDMKSDPEAGVQKLKGGAGVQKLKGGFMEKSKKIVNGASAVRTQFPHQAAMILDSDAFCGGSIISVKHILTAAHCAEGVKSFDVTLGAQNMEIDEDGRINMVTTSSLIHPRWDTNLVKNDISLIYLPRAITYNAYIQPIRLPRVRSWKRTLVDMRGAISGFGRTSDANPNVSSTLNFVNIVVIPLKECKKLYGKESVTRGNICIRGRDSSIQGTCNGDSGGPMIMRENDGKQTVFGIVSYGAATGCAKGFPDVLTRTAAYLNWIHVNTGIKMRN